MKLARPIASVSLLVAFSLRRFATTRAAPSRTLLAPLYGERSNVRNFFNIVCFPESTRCTPRLRICDAVERDDYNLVRRPPIKSYHPSKMDDVAATEWLKCRRIERGIIGLHHLFCVKYCNDVGRPSGLGVGCNNTKSKASCHC